MYSRTRLAIGVLIGIIAFSFFFSVPRTRDIVESTVLTTAMSEAPDVSLQDVFKKGVHTLTGSVEAQNACANLSVEALHEDAGAPEAHIRVAITLTPYEGTCLQLPTRMRFSAQISAPAKLPVVATVNDRPAIIETP